MMNNEWKMKLLDKTCDKVLRTIDHILEEADSHLDDDELDMLKDCWKILHCLQEIK